MTWFGRKRRNRFPDDMTRRLELLGRFQLDYQNSGIDSGDIWSECVAPFYEDSQADRDGFLIDLLAVIADDQGGFATFGASRLTWELYGSACLTIPAALPLIDAGIEFKRASGLPTAMLTGYEMQRLSQRREQTA
jgi:hypothetical protein